jgi:hypothetical protein
VEQEEEKENNYVDFAAAAAATTALLLLMMMVLMMVVLMMTVVQVPYLRRIYDEVYKQQTYTARVEQGIFKVRNSLDSEPYAFLMESAMVGNQSSYHSMLELWQKKYGGRVMIQLCLPQNKGHL